MKVRRHLKEKTVDPKPSSSRPKVPASDKGKAGPFRKEKVAKAPSIELPQEVGKPSDTLGAADSLRTVRNALTGLEGKHRERINAELAKVYTNAILLREDPDEWQRFCGDVEWHEFPGKPKIDDQPEALRFAVRMAVGFPLEEEEKKAATKRVSKLYGALRFLADDGVEPDAVVTRLQEKGIEKLSREAAQRKKQPPPATEWMIRSVNQSFAKMLAKWKPGDRRGVYFVVKSVDGMLIDADFIVAGRFNFKKTKGS